MEHFSLTPSESGLHLEGFPDGVKVIRIDGPLVQRLADLSLHKADLDFADSCLIAMSDMKEPYGIVHEALWRAAIVHFLKCFGDAGARFQLSANKILKSEPPEAMMAFMYFKGLRNKHLIHDENSYAQSVPGAVLNTGDKGYKIEKIVCFSAIAGTMGPENYGNLKLLIQTTRSWVVSEFDTLCNVLAKELEKESHESLLARVALSYRAPTLDDIQKNRKAP